MSPTIDVNPRWRLLPGKYVPLTCRLFPYGFHQALERDIQRQSRHLHGALLWDTRFKKESAESREVFQEVDRDFCLPGAS